MALPQPLSDNPTRWEGWRHYSSENYYERLCLSFDENPTAEQIEENCRQLLVWWQKKLPLKNQPSNPIAQMLRSGLDEAPGFLAEARTKLLDPESRAEIDHVVRERIVLEAVTEFKKILPFAISNKQLTEEAEERLYEGGAALGLLREEMKRIVDAELETRGAVRPGKAVTPAANGTAASAANGSVLDAHEQFRQVLRHSKLSLDGDEMTDDQRDAMCNIGESLGLSGGEAEELIDEYHEIMANLPLAPAVSVAKAPVTPLRTPPASGGPARTATATATAPPVEVKQARNVYAAPAIVHTSPMARLQEREKYPNFTNRQGLEMMLVTSGQFGMGSDAPEAAPYEQPVLPTTISCFFLSRFPVTNAQFEQFNPAHQTRRPAWANDQHPVVYVSSLEATNYCQWLSARDGRRYRLPTEAEWEYAARGTDGRAYPWGLRLDAAHFANFADARTNFPWSDSKIDDGFAETAPVGSFPRGASPFGIEEMAGNVFEWCLDFFEVYRGTNRVNPRGPSSGTKRIYRGGSWKSRAATLRATARAFNVPEYTANDVGFRVVCECE